MKEKTKNFYDLYVWKQAHVVVIEIYRITKKFPKEENYGLTSQMRRAAVSITSNIAEGYGRKNIKEKILFYRYSIGSITELQNQLFICKDVEYILTDEFYKLFNDLTSVQKLLNSLITSLITKSSAP